MEKELNIIIIEDHEIVTWALSQVIGQVVSGVQVHSATVFGKGIELLELHRAALVILDIDVPGGNSHLMLSELRAVQPDVRILMHSALPEKDHSVGYLMAGANGFLAKNAPFAMVADAIRTVLEDKKYISPATHEAISDQFLTGGTNERNRTQVYLTQREGQVIRLLLKGRWTKEIADELGLKVTTVSTHKANIFEKFGVYNPVDLYRVVQERMPELLRHL